MKNSELLKISSLSLEEVFQYFNTSYNGLDSEEVRKRYLLYGSNILASKKKFNIIKQIMKQFTSMFAILLLISSFLAFLIGEKAISISIILVVFFNGLFAFFQEYKSDKILSSLDDMIPHKVQVYRNKKVEFIDSINLTIGDVIFLDIGTTIPADARLIEANDFYIDNSMLTGETIPLNRNALSNLKENIPISDIPNLVYAGTKVTQGSAKAVVYSISQNTQIGTISCLSSTIDKGNSTLEKEIHKVIKIITIIASSLSLIVFLICFWRYSSFGENSKLFSVFKKSIIAALGMLVANIPEGLLPTINLSLAIGSQRMAKQKVLIKKLFSVETLNSTTVICTDKTGTLTENKLTCNKILFSGGSVEITGNGFNKSGNFVNFNKEKDDEILKKIFVAAIICSETNIIDDPIQKKQFQIIGNPAEGSLLIAAKKYGLNIQKIRNQFDIKKICPFTSENKKMSVFVENISQENYDLNNRFLFVKGALSVLLEECKFKYDKNKITPFTKQEKDFFILQNEKLSIKGYRLLVIAYKKIDDIETNLEEKNIIFLGLVVNYDPPKIEVREAVEQLYKAGLKITVITGDYGPTAVSIGKQVGIVQNDKYLDIDGSTIDLMPQEELKKMLKTSTPIFFSRTTPQHKLRITQAYRDIGEVVAVIGDGVNDILAMKAANIGIAMGKSGKDVARDAADIILLDDDFSTIPKALLEARGIYDNIKKFITYVFSSNIPQIFPVIFMALFNVPLYLTVMQILAIDLITDLIPAIALGAEEPKKELLKKRPITKDDRLLDSKLLKRSYGFLGLIEGILALVFFLHFYGPNLFKDISTNKNSLSSFATSEKFKFASTMAFGAVIFAQIGNVFACRSDKLYFWHTINKKNFLLYFGILCEFILFILISRNFNFLNNFFGTNVIRIQDYFYLFLCIFVVLFLDSVYKFINKKINN
ncbi:MAG: cation-transporting P-type ATPase [Candidatus Phytoplasma stylosanthis]|uniref:cation-translocating P-type ATPase n=1 Tax=Candidatus Phytoplasma stylosanthis TaxID=2798314 RepID=UPI00293A0B37|nr:cation-transporting P-type ATPase [Candidatus Phytoplasma stylosanthis]MDV3168092.1 cation-transporting P-type ATPase [Candidatus Phytoplasma stylosanthis]MDV3171095.1 cation-transporting P-type ATPase [Candidatus Phytoplasma stylosanthis]MDV3174383.1 cation-transporting P-type ATPase [Candidatus Phytoplasma stylosanthis]MDV3202477.1 cation-transporting P-type ATPase [Candidatus Phytoplasma stylosanthis]